jgi:hypothetical protein
MENTNSGKINHIGVSISVPDINDGIEWYKKIFVAGGGKMDSSK